MKVWLRDTLLAREAPADLLPMIRAHAGRAIATWVPEFDRRHDQREQDDDFLMWHRCRDPADLVAQHGRGPGYVIAVGDEVQGLIILRERPEPCCTRDHSLIRVQYLVTAPWNRRSARGCGRYRGTGTLLLGQAVRESVARGCAGRVGLHSLIGSDEFYRRLGFCDLGPDPAQRGLRYFELSGLQVTHLLERIDSQRVALKEET